MKKKTVVENCEKLSIFDLRKQGALSSNEDDNYLYGNGVELPLACSNCNFGNKRWWFICPACHRRVAILYKPWDSSSFRCRHCHQLTYESSQTRRTFFEPFAMRLKLLQKYEQICVGKRGKRQLLQLKKLKKKISKLPELPQTGKTLNIRKKASDVPEIT